MSDQSGEQDFLEVIRQHTDTVYRYALYLTGEPAQAEDLTQEVFLRAHRKWRQLRNRDQVKGWLYAICRRLFLNSRRRRGSPALLSPEELDRLADAAPSPAEDGGGRLQEAMAALSPRARVLLLMFYFEGLSYREIAERLGVPIGTVMSGLFRAKNQLRARLGSPVPLRKKVP